MWAAQVVDNYFPFVSVDLVGSAIVGIAVAGKLLAK